MNHPCATHPVHAYIYLCTSVYESMNAGLCIEFLGIKNMKMKRKTRNMKQERRETKETSQHHNTIYRRGVLEALRCTENLNPSIGSENRVSWKNIYFK